MIMEPKTVVKSYEIEHKGPSVVFECPICTSEVQLHEIMEVGGKVKCINCA